MIWVGVGLLCGALIVAAALLPARRRDPAAVPDLIGPGPKRILFPFVAAGPAPRALDAALRLTRSESGTLVPVFLARVPLRLPLESPLPRQSQLAVGLQEQIEARAFAAGVPVDSRIERGRSYRHALRQTIEHEPFDRLVVAAAGPDGQGGFDAEDVAWLLLNAPGEIVVLRGPL